MKYPGFLSVMNAEEIAGIPFTSVGMIEPEGKRYEPISHEDENGYWKLVLDGEYLKRRLPEECGNLHDSSKTASRSPGQRKRS